MRKVSIDSLIGGEVLAKELYTASGITLIPAGSILKKDYIQKLKELKVNTVFIKDSKVIGYQDFNIESKIQEECKIMVRDILERYSYFAENDLEKIVVVAEKIMDDILSEPNIMYNISCVRKKDESTYSHSINVSALSVLIGLNMKLANDRIRDMAIGALLHDLGMVYLPFDYRNLVLDQCSTEIEKKIKSHVVIGYSMVEDQNWLSNVSKDIILSHHERENGSGYPMRLTKEKMRLETKIVALCDEFDSRVYGYLVKEQAVHRVVDYILSEAGRKFNFKVVQTFIESIVAYPVGSYVRTNMNEIGIVIRQNYKMPMRPVIRVIDAETNDTIIRDLVEELTVFIVEAINGSVRL